MLGEIPSLLKNTKTQKCTQKMTSYQLKMLYPKQRGENKYINPKVKLENWQDIRSHTVGVLKNWKINKKQMHQHCRKLRKEDVDG